MTYLESNPAQERLDVKVEEDLALLDRLEKVSLEIYEVRARNMLAAVTEDPKTKLTGPDNNLLKDMRKLARERLERSRKRADAARGVPDDPRYGMLGFAVSVGDLRSAWPIMEQLGAEREADRKCAKKTGKKLADYVAKEVENKWIGMTKYPRKKLDDPKLAAMPEGIKEASDEAFPRWNLLDMAAMHELLSALPQWDIPGRYGMGDMKNPRPHFEGYDAKDKRIQSIRRTHKAMGIPLGMDELDFNVAPGATGVGSGNPQISQIDEAKQSGSNHQDSKAQREQKSLSAKTPDVPKTPEASLVPSCLGGEKSEAAPVEALVRHLRLCGEDSEAQRTSDRQAGSLPHDTGPPE